MAKSRAIRCSPLEDSGRLRPKAHLVGGKLIMQKKRISPAKPRRNAAASVADPGDLPCRVLLEALNEGALLLRGDGTILHANPRFAQLTAQPVEALAGTPWSRYFSVADHGRLAELLAAAETRGVHAECALTPTATTRQPVRLSLSLVRNGGDTVFTAIVTVLPDHDRAQAQLARELELMTRLQKLASSAAPDGDLQPVLTDIVDAATLRRQMEETLQAAQEEKFRAIFDGASDGILLADPETRKFVLANAAICRMLGYTAEELCAIEIKDIHAAADRALALSEFDRIVRRDSTVVTDLPVQRKDGSVFHANISAVRIILEGTTYIAGFVRDITERKQSEAEIRRQKSLISSLIDSSADIIFFKDRAGVYLGCNPAFAALAGRSQTEIVGRTDHDIFPPAIAESFREFDRQMLESLAPQRNEEWIDYPDGRRALMETLKTPYHGPDGEVLGVLGISRDITERKQAENSLKESEARYRSLVDHLPIAVLLADASGNVITANPAVAALHQLPAPEDAVGRHLFDFIAPSEREPVRQKFAEAQTQGMNAPFESRVQREDGSELEVELSGVMVKWPPDQPANILALARDITERKQAERSLKESESRYRNLVEQLPLAVLLLDTTGRVIAGNPAANRLSRCSRVEDMRGRHMSDFIAPAERERFLAIFAETMQTGTVPQFESQTITADGEIVDSELSGVVLKDSQGQVMGFIAIAADITGRKRAQAALKASEARYRLLVENLPLGVLVMDASHRILTANRSAAALVKAGSVEELLGRSAWDFIPRHREDSDQTARALELVRHGSAPPLKLELLCADGSRVPVETRAVELRDADGTAIGFLGIAEDITERKRLDDELRASLAEQTALLKEVHHRVKNNLQVVNSLLNLQIGRLNHPAALDALRDTQARIRSMALLHETLHRQGNAGRVDARVYLGHLCMQLGAAYSPGDNRIQLHYHLHPIELELDQAIPCGLIVNELVSNAFKHAFPNGRPGHITVAMRPTERGQLHLSVADDGVGMPVEQRTPTESSLGMILVRALARQIDATLQVEGPPGTTVELIIARSRQLGFPP